MSFKKPLETVDNAPVHHLLKSPAPASPTAKRSSHTALRRRIEELEDQVAHFRQGWELTNAIITIACPAVLPLLKEPATPEEREIIGTFRDLIESAEEI